MRLLAVVRSRLSVHSHSRTPALCSSTRLYRLFEMCHEAASQERYSLRRSRYFWTRSSIMRIISAVFFFGL